MDRQFLQEVAFPESTKQVSLAITENVNQDDLAVCAIQQYIYCLRTVVNVFFVSVSITIFH